MLRTTWTLSSGALLLCAGLVGAPETGAPQGDTPQESSKARALPFLLFQDGRAEEAMEFYAELFDDGRVLWVEHYGPERPGGPEGSLFQGIVEVAGQAIRCTDSPMKHAFDFNPGVSLFVDCTSAEQLDRLVEGLSESGEAMMPAGQYGFSERFAWIQDRYGISWQLNLPFDDDPVTALLDEER